MDDQRLTRRLEALTPPNLDAGRERARLAARVKLASPPRPSEGWKDLLPDRAGPGLLSGTRLAAVAAIVALVVVGLVATPPGQAITSWVGERIGLGQPGGRPSQGELRKHAIKGRVQGSDYVILRGRSPAGPYEYITYLAERVDAPAARCFELDLPARRALQGGGCGLPAERRGLKVDAPGAVGGKGGPEAQVRFVTGRVSTDVASVDVELDGRPLPVELREVTPALAEATDVSRPFGVFLSFFRHAGRGGRVVVTARDQTGAVVAKGSRRMPDNVALQAKACREAKRLAAAGELPRRLVPGNCRGGEG